MKVILKNTVEAKKKIVVKKMILIFGLAKNNLKENQI